MLADLEFGRMCGSTGSFSSSAHPAQGPELSPVDGVSSLLAVASSAVEEVVIELPFLTVSSPAERSRASLVGILSFSQDILILKTITFIGLTLLE